MVEVSRSFVHVRSSLSFLFYVSTCTVNPSSFSIVHYSDFPSFLSACSSLATEQLISSLNPLSPQYRFLTSWSNLRLTTLMAILRDLRSSLSCLSSCSNLLCMHWTSPLSFLISSSRDFLSSAWVSVIRLSSAVCWTFYSLSSLHSCSNLARLV